MVFMMMMRVFAVFNSPEGQSTGQAKGHKENAWHN